jgi:hypothetical protein
MSGLALSAFASIPNLSWFLSFIRQPRSPVDAAAFGISLTDFVLGYIMQ